jgi:hypothetical protein
LLQKTSQKNGLKNLIYLLVFRAQKFKKKALCVQSPQGYSIENKILSNVLLQKQKQGKQYFFFN